MKFCPKCGNKLKDEQLFCPKCGESLSKTNEDEVLENEQSKLPQQRKKVSNEGGTKVVIAIVVIVLICGGGYFAYTKYQEDRQEKERIAQEQVLAEQKEKEEQEKKEQEEKKIKEEKEKEESALNAINDGTPSIYRLESEKYKEYSTLLGKPYDEVAEKVHIQKLGANPVTYIVSDPIVSSITVDDNNNINSIGLQLQPEYSSEDFLAFTQNMSNIKYDKETNTFIETNVMDETGRQIKCVYGSDKIMNSGMSIDSIKIEFAP